MYNFEFNFKLSQTTVIALCTLTGVILTTVAFKDIHFRPMAHETAGISEAMAVDMDLTVQMQGSTQSIVPTVVKDTMFNETHPDLIIFKLKKTSKVAPQGLDNFFSRLGNQNFASVSSSQLKNVTSGSSKVAAAESTINYRAMNEKKQEEKAAPTEVINHNELKNIIASHQQVFQRCYEASLLKDELLSGNASIVLSIGKNANVSFKGIGQESIKNELQKCLSQKALAMDFSNQYRGKAVKFSLFFNN